MELGLEGRTVVVTGASKGIGLAIAEAFVGEGATVVAGARHSSDELEKLVATGRAKVVEVDLGTADGPAQLVAAADAPVDILVNNVGFAKTRLGGFLDVTEEEWQQSVNLNLFAAIRAARAVLPGMIERGQGVIVNVSSVNAKLADPLVIDYSASKAALSNFAKSLSKEVGGHGIRINDVCPGPVRTDLWLGAGGVAQSVGAKAGLTPDEVAAGAAADAATGRFTLPSEVADLVLFLASDRAANITGAEFTIDGGLIQTV
ncbi:SDR family NAD(P)-dependent oxidoreductase [Gryllotalpicola protaetiae]|uniref:SDR family oxidoreductase n=1 Tax=Gryllotalpicola protaetiae TaxID=2419771 RepID=A0A387BNG7_9MICO|nr:oxidoreductase [Gryllotalpicola protaetiae]AYG02659.1 SDR family oxidoreductase [Gryllotalpicola protaetiae]